MTTQPQTKGPGGRCTAPGPNTRRTLPMQKQRTRRGGQPPAIDLDAFARQVANAAGTTAPSPPAPSGDAPILDRRGYRRPAQSRPGHAAGRAPGNKGREYRPDPPTTAEVVAMLEACDGSPDLAELRAVLANPARSRMSPGLRRAVCNLRLRALIVVLWRGGLRISEGLALLESDLNLGERSLVVQHGKGDKRRIVGMDDWAWEHLQPWINVRREFKPGPLFCVVEGPTTGTTAWRSNDARQQIHKLARRCGIRRRVAPHQLRHAHAVELAREGIGLHLVSRQLGHANLAITTTYLQGISPAEVVGAVAGRRPPMVTALSGHLALEPSRGPEVVPVADGRRAPAWPEAS